jgi:hypothetical protein
MARTPLAIPERLISEAVIQVGAISRIVIRVVQLESASKAGLGRPYHTAIADSHHQ